MKCQAKFPSQRECRFVYHARLIQLWAGVLCLFSFMKLLHITDEAWAPCKRLYCTVLGFSMLWTASKNDHRKVRLLFICFFFTQTGLNMQFLRNMKPKALPLHILLDLVVNLWVVFPQLRAGADRHASPHAHPI
ncbi:hypothetical protein DUNSADRAFT_6726 [Dunaliella salina]|uniref:Uncharacterized protein n=1 Tax=Dunaliella salina TaxID=3046 RepID=A0ABQ7H6J1_DUNSA|nr:hypothetical protein DUNSADRAFT_6726 [Dunaliella salina]|eukprot:KAF5842482.1 hypothetical protein DUNSADRAFT_6726 [Dunaliella salina]